MHFKVIIFFLDKGVFILNPSTHIFIVSTLTEITMLWENWHEEQRLRKNEENRDHKYLQSCVNIVMG